MGALSPTVSGESGLLHTPPPPTRSQPRLLHTPAPEAQAGRRKARHRLESTGQAGPTATHDTHIVWKPLSSPARHGSFIPRLQMWKQKPREVMSLLQVAVSKCWPRSRIPSQQLCCPEFRPTRRAACLTLGRGRAWPCRDTAHGQHRAASGVPGPQTGEPLLDPHRASAWWGQSPPVAPGDPGALAPCPVPGDSICSPRVPGDQLCTEMRKTPIREFPVGPPRALPAPALASTESRKLSAGRALDTPEGTPTALQGPRLSQSPMACGPCSVPSPLCQTLLP